MTPILPVASVLGVVVHDAKVLLVRRINPPDAKKWGFPGGWIDPGKTMAQAAVPGAIRGDRYLGRSAACSTRWMHSTTIKREPCAGNS